MLHSICQHIWKTQQWPQDRKRSAFIPIPKKGNAKECSNYHTIALVSYASKIMLKILQASLQQYVNHELQMFKLDLEKAEEPEIKLSTSVGSSKKQETSRKISTSALGQSLWLCGLQQTMEILQEIGTPDHMTCLLRNLYAGQDVTVRTTRGKNRLVPNQERSTSRLHIVTLLI